MKLTKMLLLIAFVALFGCSYLFGQTLTGAAIPDSTAQRLYFLSLSNLDAPTRQAHFTYSAQLPAADIADAITAVDNFKTSYDQAVTQYNTAVANGSGVLSTFQREQANITAIAIGYVQSHLSVRGYTALQEDIASAKNRMVIPYGQTTMAMAGTTTTTTNMGCCYSLVASQTVNVISRSPFHATVTFSRTVEGSNTISDPSIKHRGSVTAHVGTQSQTYAGQWLTPNIYINLNANVMLDSNVDACLMSDLGCLDSSLSSVTCTVGGLVFAVSFPGIDFRLAYTKSVVNSEIENPSGNATCYTSSWCTPLTTPPLCNPSYVFQLPLIVGMTAKCYNYYNTIWMWEKIGSFAGSCIPLIPGQNATGTQDSTPYSCTH